MPLIPNLNCPTCGTKMEKKEIGGNPTWFCFVEDCPCKSLEGEYEE